MHVFKGVNTAKGTKCLRGELYIGNSGIKCFDACPEAPVRLELKSCFLCAHRMQPEYNVKFFLMVQLLYTTVNLKPPGNCKPSRNVVPSLVKQVSKLLKPTSFQLWRVIFMLD